MSLENEEMEKELKDEKSNAAFLRWFKPVIQALRDLGGSATPADTRAKIIENEKLTSEAYYLNNVPKEYHFTIK